MRNDGTYLAQLLQEQQRPHPMYMRQQYHFMGGPGWINDPNGLVWYKDAYHFFYQYNPFGLTWGEPCWGHAVSRDLLHWTQLPPALVPSEPYDMYEQGGCFSGCALVVGQRLYLLYTGVCEKDGHCVQAQCLAWSDDGVTFQKYENNPVVCAPVGVDPANFRDPKLWREADGIFYFVCGASLEGEGAALLFSSQDLFQWQYQGVLARSGGRFGTMWECPDLIPLGRKHMLCVSPMHCPAYRNVCLVGTFSREEGKLLNVEPVCPDAGPDYYAAQSFVDDRGQCVQVAWANGWDWMPQFRRWGVAEQGFWRGWFTLPRVVTEGADKLPRFQPHPQLETLRKKSIPWGRKELTAPWTLPDAAETAWEILLEIPAQQQTGGLLLQVGSCFALELTLVSRTLHAYARDSGEQTMQDCGTLQLAPGAPVRLQVFLDRCSAEIFADGKCLSVNVFDTAPLRPVSLIPQGGTLPLQLLQVWQLQHVMEPQT